MILSKKMETALNEQIMKETASAYLYWAMSAYFEDQDLPGFSHWMRRQAVEELEHASKIFDFVNDREGRVIFGAIDAPQAEWNGPLDAFEAVYKHEQFVSKSIVDLFKLAREDEDASTENFLQWFVAEQTEEEKNAVAIVKQLRRVGDSGQGLFMIDRELGRRGD